MKLRLTSAMAQLVKQQQAALGYRQGPYRRKVGEAADSEAPMWSR